MPRKGSSLAKSLEPHQLHDQLLWSSQWDVVVMWLYGLGQVDPGQVLGLMSVVLNYENSRGSLICSVLPGFLPRGKVSLAPQNVVEIHCNGTIVLILMAGNPALVTCWLTARQ